MTPIAQADSDFAFAGIPPVEEEQPDVAAPHAADPLGPLAQLPGTWKGNGFNAIWRPHHPFSPQDRFLELNLTSETLVFSKINGAIPNRGLEMPDISMFGITYIAADLRDQQWDGSARRARDLGPRSGDDEPK